MIRVLFLLQIHVCRQPRHTWVTLFWPIVMKTCNLLKYRITYSSVFYCARGDNPGTMVTWGSCGNQAKTIMTRVCFKCCDPDYNDGPGHDMECHIQLSTFWTRSCQHTRPWLISIMYWSYSIHVCTYMYICLQVQSGPLVPDTTASEVTITLFLTSSLPQCGHGPPCLVPVNRKHGHIFIPNYMK